MFKDLLSWAKEFRLIFLLFVILPIMLGAAVAFRHDPAGFSLLYFVLTLAAILLLHAGTIALNSYFDYKSHEMEKTDYPNDTVLASGVLSPSTMFVAGLICFILCIVLGAIIVFTRSFILMPIGVIGVGIGYFYSSPPLKLTYRFLGAPAWFGSMILMPLGALMAQIPINSFADLSQAIPAIETIIFAALPLAFMGTVGIYILEFPDYNKEGTMKNWRLNTVFGREYGLPVFIVLSALGYLSLVAGIVLGLIPLIALFALVTLPLIAFAALGLRRFRGKARNMVQFIEITIVAWVVTGLILFLSFLIS